MLRSRILKPEKASDSDLRFPVEQARSHVPVGVINPARSPVAYSSETRRP
jgi:hypothetical protein